LTPAAVCLREVTVVRAGRRILDIPALDVHQGECLGVVGVNGAGKTTLLRLCAGLLRPTSGAVWLNGASLAAIGAWGLTRLRAAIGYLPQATDYNAHLPLTLEEVVAMGRAGCTGLLRRLGPADRECVRGWMERLGLAPLAGRTFPTLSGGEQQKVLLARAMVQEPGLLLLDEPGANLDLDWKARLVGLLEEVVGATGVTVVMVSHETGLLPACCTRVALMRAGRVLRLGRPAEVLTADALADVYGCPIEVAEVQGRRHAVASRGGAR